MKFKNKLCLILATVILFSFSGCSKNEKEATNKEQTQAVETDAYEELDSLPHKSLFVDSKTDENKKVFNTELRGDLYNNKIMLQWNSDDKYDTFFVYLYYKETDEYVLQAKTKSNRITLNSITNKLGETEQFKNDETYNIQIYVDKNRKTELANNKIKITYQNLNETPSQVIAYQESDYIHVEWAPVENAVNYAVYVIDNFREYYAKQLETTETTINLTTLKNQYDTEVGFEEGFKYTLFVIAQKEDGTWSDMSTASQISFIYSEPVETTEFKIEDYTETVQTEFVPTAKDPNMSNN